MEQPGTLMEEVQRLLQERKDVTHLAIYNALRIPPSWIRKFQKGHFPNPGVNRVQALYEFLSGKKLTF